MNKMNTHKDSSALMEGLRVQVRVVGALLLREIITRYGRHNLGFLWLLFEPVIFTVGVVILWGLIHGDHGYKVPVAPFIVTGYSGLLLWRNCSSRGIKAIEPNRSLMHHRQVKIQDIFFARMVLELAGVTASVIVLMVSMNISGLMNVPADFSLMLIGWGFMSWFSVNLGVILGCLSEYSEVVERLWHPISYFMLAISGTFFMVDWLPAEFHDLVLWVPMTNAIEMIRGGYWGGEVKTYYSIGYMFSVCLLMTFLALVLMADRRLKQLN